MASFTESPSFTSEPWHCAQSSRHLWCLLWQRLRVSLQQRRLSFTHIRTWEGNDRVKRKAGVGEKLLWFRKVLGWLFKGIFFDSDHRSTVKQESAHGYLSLCFTQENTLADLAKWFCTGNNTKPIQHVFLKWWVWGKCVLKLLRCGVEMVWSGVPWEKGSGKIQVFWGLLVPQPVPQKLPRDSKDT